MPSKRYSVEQIVAKLREAERLQAQGQTIAQVCKRLGISDQTFFRWRIKYGALKEDEAQRLKALEQENARLKKIVASRRWTSRCRGISSGENGEPGAPARCRPLPRAALPGLGASGLSSARPASLDAALPTAAPRIRTAFGEAHERARRPPPPLRLSARVEGPLGFLEAPMPGSVLAEGDAPAMSRPRKYSDELRERAVRFYFEQDRPIAHVAQGPGDPQGSAAAVGASG
jgi:putative transposase